MKNEIAQANSWIEENRKIISVAIVSNLTPSKQEKFKISNLRLKDRYFSQKTVTEFVDGFRRMGICTHLFCNESEFISSLATESYPINKNAINFVYNLTEPGIGAGGISLISAVSRFYGLIFCNSDPHSSTMGRHKYHSYSVLKSHGISIPESWWYIGEGKWCSDRNPPQGQKVIAKSTYESCSIGIEDKSVFIYDGNTSTIDRMYHRIKQPIFVQSHISGKEISVPVVVDRHATAIDIVLNTDESSDNLLLTEFSVFSNEAPKKSKLLITNDSVRSRIKKNATSVATILGFKGICRIDFKLDQDLNPFVIDVGAVPVLYKGSSVQLAAEWNGISTPSLLSLMLMSSYSQNQISTQE